MTTAGRSANKESSGLTLWLQPETAVFHRDDEPNITARLTNGGDRPLRLVMPGDGSHSHWRTPGIEWMFTPEDKPFNWGRGCGNVRGLRRGEVFTLEPGQSRKLEGIQPRWFPGIPSFRASITYSNDPHLPFIGVPTPPHDEAELALVRKSHRCRVRSNEVSISFEDYPADAQRIWFPEMIARLRELWSDSLSCDQLIALRNEIQGQLGAIRTDRGLKSGVRWILQPSSDTHPAIRLPQWCVEAQIPVRAVILAIGRFDIADADVVSDIEQRWRLLRKANGLDLYGARTPSKPMQPTTLRARLMGKLRGLTRRKYS